MLGNKAYEDTVYTRMKVKYGQFQPSIIIASDDYAVDFLLQFKDELFPQVPVVYLGVNFPKAALDAREDFVGIVEGMDIKGNINLILQVLPHTESVILLMDNTSFGTKVRQITTELITVQQSSGAWTNVEFQFWDALSFNELMTNVAKLPPTSAVLLTAIHNDTQGRYFSYTRDLPPLTQSASVPIFGMFGSVMLGNGILGGKINSPYHQGSVAANMAIQLLEGQPITALPKQQFGTYLPKFDYRVIQRFNVDTSLLPPDTDIQYTPNHNLQQSPKLLYTTVAVAFALLMFIAIYSHARRRIAEERANTDSLTLLPNRRAGEAWLTSQWSNKQARLSGFAIGVLDIDHFKRINDTYGHDSGDKVLIEVANRIKMVLRNSDHLYRWGGEEFVIYFDFSDLDALEKINERIRKAIRNIPIEPAGTVTASIGVALSEDYNALESLLLEADKALYIAKANGRDCVYTAKV